MKKILLSMLITLVSLGGSAALAADRHAHAAEAVAATSKLPREGGLVPAALLPKTNSEWSKVLTPEQYKILRMKGTEPANTGKLLTLKEKGSYRCAACGQPLFDGASKYDSKTGWPSFFQPVSPTAISSADDSGFFLKRTEVLCARCGGHLGHVSNDGPQPTGLRYCINSTALTFEPAK